MQAQACFNQPQPALPPILLPPLPSLAGASAAPVFRGGAADSAAGAWGGAGTAAAASAGALWRSSWRWRRQSVLAWDHRWVRHGSSLGDELAGQVLGSWTSPSAGFLEDVVAECSERITELCLIFVRGMASNFPHNNITLVSVDG